MLSCEALTLLSPKQPGNLIKESPGCWGCGGAWPRGREPWLRGRACPRWPGCPGSLSPLDPGLSSREGARAPAGLQCPFRVFPSLGGHGRHHSASFSEPFPRGCGALVLTQAHGAHVDKTHPRPSGASPLVCVFVCLIVKQSRTLRSFSPRSSACCLSLDKE